MKTLTSARSHKCSFPSFASADWDRNPPLATGASQKDFSPQIAGVDYAKTSAKIIGNAGAADLAAARERHPIRSSNERL